MRPKSPKKSGSLPILSARNLSLEAFKIEVSLDLESVELLVPLLGWTQIREIEAAGFAVAPYRIIVETVSGSVAIAQRKGFSRLFEKMEPGDVLVVTKLDRLGRDAIDVSSTVSNRSLTASIILSVNI